MPKRNTQVNASIETVNPAIQGRAVFRAAGSDNDPYFSGFASFVSLRVSFCASPRSAETLRPGKKRR